MREETVERVRWRRAHRRGSSVSPPRDMRAVVQRKARLVKSGQRWFARQHEARPRSFASKMTGENLIDRHAGSRKRTLLNRDTGEQVAGLRGVNSVAVRRLV